MPDYDMHDYWKTRSLKVLKEGPGKGLYRRDVSEEGVPAGVVNWLTSNLQEYEEPDVLEVGSGFGRWSHILKGCCGTFTGVDIVAERVRYACEKWPSASFSVVSPSGQWDLERCFDVILSITVLQHVPSAPAVELLKSMKRCLKPGGVMLLAEWRLTQESKQQAEAINARTEMHMHTKSIPALVSAVGGITMTGVEGRYVVRHA